MVNGFALFDPKRLAHRFRIQFDVEAITQVTTMSVACG
jgi:hypothetical protein